MKKKEYKFKASLNCILRLSGEGGHRGAEVMRERKNTLLTWITFLSVFLKVKREDFKL